jgi:hypothetical protein
LFQSDVDDRDDPVVAVDDDDLITNNEIHVPAPLGMDLDERRGNLHDSHTRWHRSADADREVDVINPGHIPAGQDRLSDLRPLLRCQVYAAARLALLGLALLGLALLRRLPGLALLTLLPLRGLTLGLVSLLALRLRLLILLPLALARGLFFLLALRLALLAAILLGPLIALALRSLFSLGRLARGLFFLLALRLALLFSLRGLRRLALLRRRLRLLALRGTAALLASALHALG